MKKNRIIDSMLATARDLDFDPMTIRELEQLRLNEMKALQATLIKNIRVNKKEKSSHHGKLQ